MKYVVVSCIEREIEVEAVCNTYEVAFEIMKEHFLNHERDCGVVREHLESLEEMIRDNLDVELDSCGFHKGMHNTFAWSNTDEDNKYDIKILEV